ncbi:unnamed protein product [Protopolystoma xenopodis]|uniref:Uncharacterized protein n=1 Tax=Protopolystoma xenopodis TaxID=117903 RepID=A0A3S5AW61_9PLAT|nr:unnamed protein product [Protopolystoma xenopodis]
MNDAQPERRLPHDRQASTQTANYANVFERRPRTLLMPSGSHHPRIPFNCLAKGNEDVEICFCPSTIRDLIRGVEV